MGIKVKIMLPHDPSGRTGPKNPIPDCVEIIEPRKEKDEREIRTSNP